MLKKISISLFLLLFVLLVSFFVLKTPDTDSQAMIAKYGKGAIRIEDGLGGNIYYRDQGTADGPVLLLVHGGNSSMQTWNGMINVLASSYRIISFDLYGHGITGSHPNNDYSANAYIDGAVKVLDAVGVDKAVWVGNSMGGWLTWRAAIAVPERVAGVVLMDASGAQGGEEPDLYLAAKLIKSPIFQKLAKHITPRFIVKSSLEDNYADNSKITDQLIDQNWELFRFPGNREAIAYRVNTSREPEMWNRLNEVYQPTLIMWGEQDVIVPFSDAALFQEKLPHSKLVTYPNSSHLPMEELPIDVANDLDQWMQHNFIE